MNTNSKADLFSILRPGLHIPSNIPDADLKAYVLIGGRAVNQSLGNAHGC